MKLTVEQIKEAIERFKPDGFEYNDNIPNTWVLEERHYDCFLDRTIHGMIFKGVIDFFKIDKTCVCYKTVGNQFLIMTNGTIEEIREAREKAIIFVLEEPEK